jgi:hypothetical protein
MEGETRVGTRRSVGDKEENGEILRRKEDLHKK